MIARQRRVFASLALGLTFCVPPLPAGGWPVNPAPFDVNLSDRTILAAHRVSVKIRSGVASVELSQTYRENRHLPEPGSEAVFRLYHSPLATAWAYKITELGEWHEGMLRDTLGARTEYDAIVGRRRDPGLLEWESDVSFRSSIYPVPPRGGTKDAVIRYDEALAVDSLGRMSLRLPLSILPMERLELAIEASDPRGIARATFEGPLELRPSDPDPAVWTASGRFDNVWLMSGEARLVLEPKGASGQAAGVIRPVVLPDGRFLAAVPSDPPGASRHYLSGGFLIGRRAPAADGRQVVVGRQLVREHGKSFLVDVRLDFDRAMAAGPELAPSWERLNAVAAVLHSARNGEAGADAAMQLAREANVVTPWTSFFARPGQVAARVPDRKPVRETPSGNPAAARKLLEPVQPAEHKSSGPMIELPWPESGLLVPNFRTARSRSNLRTCFAYQKTIAGALEMLFLDENLSMADILAAAGRTAPDPVPPFAPIEGSGIELLVVPEPASTTVLGTGHDPWLLAFPLGLRQRLVQGGYLQSLPSDPGFDSEGFDNYLLAGFGQGVFCLRHGQVEGRQGASPRQQLGEAGVEDPDWLAAASPDVPRDAESRGTRTIRMSRETLQALLATWVSLVVLLAFGFRATGTGWRAMLRHSGRSALAGAALFVLFWPLVGFIALAWALAVLCAAAASRWLLPEPTR